MSSKLLRANMLKQLRKHARAQPDVLRSESYKLCDKLYTHIMSQYCQGVTSTHCMDKQFIKSLLVLSYLPLYYEVDLRPLMHRLWQCNTNTIETCTSSAHTRTMCKEECKTNRENTNTTEQCTSVCEEHIPSICIMVPVVLDPTTWSTITTRTTNATTNSNVPEKEQNNEWPSWLPHMEQDGDGGGAVERLRGAMMFVEVFDEIDLENSFEEYGKFHIVELKRELLNILFVQRKVNVEENTINSEKELLLEKENLYNKSAQTHSSVDKTCTHPRIRRTLFSRPFAELFPDYLPLIGEVHWEHCCSNISTNTPRADVSSSSSSTAVLLLAPGVYFDRTSGARIGKGGGYYDRFIHFHRLCSAHKD